MQGFDAGRTNHRADANPPRGDLVVAWRAELRGHGPPRYQPVAYGDLVVVPDRGVTAFDRSDGAVAFHVDAPEAGLALADASAYRTPTLVAGDDRVVAGLDAAGGLAGATDRRVARRWRFGEAEDALFPGMGEEPTAATTPVAADGRVVHATRDGDVVARNASSGRAQWRFATSYRADGFAVGEHVYVAEQAGSVHALDPADGRVEWTHGENGAWTGVAAADGTVFLNAGRGVAALDAADGTVRWRTSDEAVRQFWTDGAVPTVVDDRVLLVGDDAVHGFDRATGERAWKRALDVATVPHVPVADDLALVPTSGDGLVALDATTGRTAWEHEFAEPWPVGAPVVADGRVYVAVGEKLVCLEGSR